MLSIFLYKFVKIRVVRRPSRASQMSQTSYTIDKKFQLFLYNNNLQGRRIIGKQSVWKSYVVYSLFDSNRKKEKKHRSHYGLLYVFM